MRWFSKESPEAAALKDTWKKTTQTAQAVFERNGDRRPEAAMNAAATAYHQQVRRDKASKKT